MTVKKRDDISKKKLPHCLYFDRRGLELRMAPKALIHFHAYREGATATALEEHLVEAASCLRDRAGRTRLHLTVSVEHQRAIRAELAA